MKINHKYRLTDIEIDIGSQTHDLQDISIITNHRRGTEPVSTTVLSRTYFHCLKYKLYPESLIKTDIHSHN